MDLSRLVSERIAPERDSFRTAGNLPSAQQLLGQALAERRIRLRRITEGRWVFIFGDAVIGGWSQGVTTLVSAHGRRVLAKPESVAAHLDLMDIPHRIGRADAEPAGRTLSSEDPAEEDEEQDDDDPPQTLTLEVYTAGEHAVSVLALVDRDLLPDPQPSEPPTIAVDVTDLVAEELKQLGTDALRAVPGVLAGATTLSAASLDSAQHAAVLDVSAEASPLPHTYPTLGPGRPVSAAIAEQLLATAAV